MGEEEIMPCPDRVNPLFVEPESVEWSGFMIFTEPHSSLAGGDTFQQMSRSWVEEWTFCFDEGCGIEYKDTGFYEITYKYTDTGWI